MSDLPPSRLPVLALDTSTEMLAAGLHTGRDSFTCLAAGGAMASARLLPELQGLLARAGLALADVQAVAFGQGPGAFTGLRTACAVAQGLGFGLGRRVLPLCSLLVVAEDARAQLGAGAADITVLMDARMDEVYAGRYQCHTHEGGSCWQVLQAPQLMSLAALQARWGAEGSGQALQVVCGSALGAFGPRLGIAALGQGAVVLAQAANPCGTASGQARTLQAGARQQLDAASRQALDAAMQGVDRGLDPAFAAAEAGIDKYLDWYFSFIGSYARMGALVVPDLEQHIVVERHLTPQGIERWYNAEGGAIYGLASHGKLKGGFKPRNRSRLYRNLYLAGGSANPGPGVPMVLMSGVTAADAVCEDLGVARTSHGAPGFGVDTGSRLLKGHVGGGAAWQTA
jgi:tRNA threonylcarbamoyladenosine biosynthesis protein TsaB